MIGRVHATYPQQLIPCLHLLKLITVITYMCKAAEKRLSLSLSLCGGNERKIPRHTWHGPLIKRSNFLRSPIRPFPKTLMGRPCLLNLGSTCLHNLEPKNSIVRKAHFVIVMLMWLWLLSALRNDRLVWPQDKQQLFFTKESCALQACWRDIWCAERQIW